ncbi:MAG: nitroreductase family protein [Candidatus Methanoperedens sp.]|nr:nitroreductase family protein [Candidatus Methanoperedens sp.]
MKESDIVLDVIKKRRSIRKFNSTKIPDECMAHILEAGRWVSSGANAQSWRFIVVTKKKTLAAIAEKCYWQPRWT